MKLQKLLSQRGVASRRTAEEWIAAGRVTIDGRVAKVGDIAEPDKAEILLDGKPLPSLPEPRYIILNKPRGIVTTMDDERGRRAVWELLPKEWGKLLPAGRLDMDSEGLLLMTNDGEAIAWLTHPSHEIDKEYHVTVKGDITSALSILRNPMNMDGKVVGPARVEVLGEQKLAVVIKEGRNRQVRRMCAAVELDVRRLVRVRIGELTLEGLKAGDFRELTDTEKAWLCREL